MVRIEIIKPDENTVVEKLWNGLYNMTIKDEDITIHMTSDGGKTGNKRALIINIKSLKPTDILIT